MADEFAWSVQLGLQIAKRIYYGKQVLPPPPTLVMERKSETTKYVPTALMVYAVIKEPWIVDNPDILSYQPYVHGSCDPPALIPLHMHGIEMEVDCYLDTAFVTMTGTWRVHCVTASKACDCRIAVPIGQEGSVLGVEVECPTRSYSTQLVKLDTKDVDKAKDGFLLKRQIYTLKVPQVGGGSSISVKVRWSQKLQYQENQFCLSVPFSFQPYVNPIGKKIFEREKILLNVNCSAGLEILCGSVSHPLKEVRRQAGMLGFSYEKEVSTWSRNDFTFLYSVSSHDIFGSVLLQSPSLHDFDQRDMLCFYLYPGNANTRKVFRKEIVFIVDISASMKGGPLESVKAAVVASLSKLNPADAFNIIAYNGNSLLFSSSMELANMEAIENAIQWITRNFRADGGTNILLPLSQQALQMMSKSSDSISIVFLITDGTVEDEKDICDLLKGQLKAGDLSSPRICTFGIGLYCNHYFLQALAQIGRGYYDAAFDVDSISFCLERQFSQSSSIILADISISSLGDLDSLELYPFNLPDLSSGSPLIVSGRYAGKLPDTVTVEGTLADLGKFSINAKVQNRKDIPMERVLAKRQIDALTANAWLSGSKQIEEKIANISLQTGVPSEYTNMILVETSKQQQASKLDVVPEMAEKNPKKIIILRSLGYGFGSLKATIDNLPPETAEPKLHETSEIILKAASKFCSRIVDRCCCMCFIQFCSEFNDQCAVVGAQLCTALACFECINFCSEVCELCSG